MTEPARPTGSGPGCLIWLAALAGAALLALLVWFVALRGTDDQDPAAAPSGSTTTPTATVTPAGCADATGEFQGSAAGPGVEYVRGACWESGGQLRVEIELAADINVDSAPMQGLCATVTDFILASGRPWQGFTAYSSSPLTPGQAMLTRTQPDQPCQRPVQ